MFRGRFFQIILLTAVNSVALGVLAQDTSEPNPIKWTIRAQPAPPSSNKTLFNLELRATIERGWHLYSTEKIEGGPSPTRITLVPGQTLEIAGDIDSPAPHSAYDPNFQVATEYYEGEVAFTIPLKSTAPAVAEQVRLQVRYQTCTPTICLPPKLIELAAALNGSQTKTSAPEEKAATTKAATPETNAIDFEFVDFTGKPRRFAEFRGRVVLLDFWASWCSPCLADIPQLKTAYQKYRGQGFEILGMDSETLGQKDVDAEFAKDAQVKAREIVNTRGVTWTQATAESSVLVAAGTFAVQNLPAKFLIDRDGRIVRRITNALELDEILPRLLKPQP